MSTLPWEIDEEPASPRNFLLEEAAKVAGWPDCTALDVIEAMYEALQKLEALYESPVSPAVAMDWAQKWTETKGYSVTPHWKHIRRKLIQLKLAGYTDEMMAELFMFTTEQVREMCANEQDTEVLKLHAEGKSLIEITKATGASRSSVGITIAAVGQKARTQPKGHLRAALIREDRHKGLTYPELREKYGVTNSVIGNAIRPPRTTT